MRAAHSASSFGGRLGWPGLCVAAGLAVWGGPASAGSKPADSDLVAQGYEIFAREWMPNDPRGHGGDGLGPVYNDTSCVACHNAGGGGGGGPLSKNIDILSASRNLGGIIAQPPGAGQSTKPVKPSLDVLTEVHPGFRSSRSVVLHKFGVDPNYNSWRSMASQPAVAPDTDPVSPIGRLPGFIGTATQQANADPEEARAETQIQQIRAAVAAANAALQSRTVVGEFLVARSQRNPSALFGLGLIDEIPVSAIEAIARDQARKSPEIQGRISRLKDGRVGRLGWKGQIASVEDFVLNACAVEVGLEVPGHHQAMSPQAPKYRTTGLDLTSDECAALVAYVRSLPQPAERRPTAIAEAKHIKGGRTLFASVGCASCHAPNVGDVKGIFSDLMLHDMGPESQDEGSYFDDGGDPDDPFGPFQQTGDLADNGKPTPAMSKGANPREWRTPPLWGFRDSGPYLHDGRAHTLEQAVAMHGGQAAASATNFFNLSPAERLQIEAFLKTLVAPTPGLLASRAE
jgi:CxxC motif-containing protein (DUF1111 family)